jgi:hypothetical protein
MLKISQGVKFFSMVNIPVALCIEPWQNNKNRWWLCGKADNQKKIIFTKRKISQVFQIKNQCCKNKTKASKTR